jgi:hypothetical protein
MNFIEPRPFVDSDAAARKLMELAHAFEPVQDDRIYIEKINEPFLYQLKGTPAEYKAGLDFGFRRPIAEMARGNAIIEKEANYPWPP